MNVDLEYCDPFDGSRDSIWMKIEHCGRYQFAVDRIAAMGMEHCRILDAACADGYGTEMLCRDGWQVTGADRSAEYLLSANSRGCSASFIHLDFDRNGLPFSDGEMDAVVCFETLEHLEHPGRFLAEMARVLHPEGLLLLSFPNALYEKLDENGNNKDPFHKHIFQLDDVMYMVEALFSVESILGQFLSNQAYALESKAVKAGVLSQEEVSDLYRYDAEAIRVMSRALAYPCDLHVNDSYSYLIVARRK